MTGPSILPRSRDARQVQCISVDVSNGCDELRFVGDLPGVEAPAKERPEAVVDVPGVQRPEALHRWRQASVGTVPQVVEVSIHQAVGVGDDPEVLVRIGKLLAVFDSVAVVEEDDTAVDAPIHDMEPTVFDVRAQWSRHAPIMNRGCHNSGLTRVVIQPRKGSRDLDRPGTAAILLQARITPGMKLSRS